MPEAKFLLFIGFALAQAMPQSANRKGILTKNGRDFKGTQN